MIAFGSAARRWLSHLALLSILLVAPPAFAGWNAIPERIANHSTWIYTPNSSLAGDRRGLLVALHGCDQTNTQLRNFGNLVKAAEENGLVLALPGVGRQSFGPGCWHYDGSDDPSGHVAQITSLARELSGRGALNIDPAHIYVVGLSSGASLALLLGCSAPDLFAGIGAIAGPSVGSAQQNALADAADIPPTNVSDAVATCRSMAGDKASHFATQAANIAYGDMDRNGSKAQFSYRLGDTSHPGQYLVVSIKWSEDNARALQEIYGTGDLGTATDVQDGKGTERSATVDGRVRLGQLVIHDVGHAWPAGTGMPNNAFLGGVWMAHQGLDYPSYIADWLIRNNLRTAAVDTADEAAWTCREYAADNVTHVLAGRAYNRFGIAHANGSDQAMGPNNIFVQTTLAETREDFYMVGSCP